MKITLVGFRVDEESERDSFHWGILRFRENSKWESLGVLAGELQVQNGMD